MFRERPVSMSAPMVRAILAGRKTQTRRTVKYRIEGPNPPTGIYDWHDPKSGEWKGAHGAPQAFSLCNAARLCPYGAPGDRLWVKEAYRLHKDHDPTPASRVEPDANVWYCADDHIGTPITVGRYRNARFMPRRAGRIVLEVKEIRVERLNEISEEDALSEGVFRPTGERTPVGQVVETHDGGELIYAMRGQARDYYQDLWNTINGPRSWTANPWVWVVAFSPISGWVQK